LCFLTLESLCKTQTGKQWTLPPQEVSLYRKVVNQSSAATAAVTRTTVAAVLKILARLTVVVKLQQLNFGYDRRPLLIGPDRTHQDLSESVEKALLFHLVVELSILQNRHFVNNKQQQNSTQTTRSTPIRRLRTNPRRFSFINRCIRRLQLVLAWFLFLQKL